MISRPWQWLVGWRYLPFLFSLGGCQAQTSTIDPDETVLFFPAIAHRNADGTGYVVRIHGWIHEPETDSRTRNALISLIRKQLEDAGLVVDERAAGLLEERVRSFLVDNERGERIWVRLEGTEYPLPASKPNGHFAGTIEIPAARVQPPRGNWLAYHAVTREGDSRQFHGRSLLLEPEGTSVISDIDDTIKVSNVRNKKELLANTFLRPFQAVPDMAGLYARWEEEGAQFHYVSASPWQLYEPLARFIEDGGFPKGTFHLKDFRFKDRDFFNLFESPEIYKQRIIEPILATFPRRQFILVGDTGEQDPEVYGHLARRHPEQIRHIFIRRATPEDDPERYRRAFEDIPEDHWTIFHTPSDVRTND